VQRTRRACRWWCALIDDSDLEVLKAAGEPRSCPGDRGLADARAHALALWAADCAASFRSRATPAMRATACCALLPWRGRRRRRATSRRWSRASRSAGRRLRRRHAGRAGVDEDGVHVVSLRLAKRPGGRMPARAAPRRGRHAGARGMPEALRQAEEVWTTSWRRQGHGRVEAAAGAAVGTFYHP